VKDEMQGVPVALTQRPSGDTSFGRPFPSGFDFQASVGSSQIDVIAAPDEIPGRGDLRISLTNACNLRCAHCHNEGQPPPWLCDPDKPLVRIPDIEDLVAVGHRHGAKSVKFTGGEPAMHPEFAEIVDAVAGWRLSYPGIRKWGISSNGTPFLSRRRFDLLIASSIDNVCIGIDSVSTGERIRPSSPIGPSGRLVLERVVKPLADEWSGLQREIKVNVVYAGDTERTQAVVRSAYEIGVNVSVIEVNGVMGTRHDVRQGFLALAADLAKRYGLVHRLDELNEIQLCVPGESGRARLRFYQDHCADADCGSCRKVHMRVNPMETGWAAIPCFLRGQADVLPLMSDDGVSDDLFAVAARVNGAGPDWRRAADALLADR
jgi:molybdenum cofactor biosynthesis enzyme MoaA